MERTNIDCYYNELVNAYDHNDWFYAENTDRMHNATIMRVMLEKASKIYMYCGELSVLRDSFYSHIEKQNRELGISLKEDVSKAFDEFIKNRSNSLEIIMENYSEDFFRDLIINKELLKGENVKILYLPDAIEIKKNLPHIAFTQDDRMVRIELNKETHEAICKIGTDKDERPLSESFNRLQRLAEQVTIPA